MSKLFSGRSSVFLAGVVVIIALLAVSVWWVLRPSYVALYKDASEASQAEILAILSQRQVPYRINAKAGVIEVAAEEAATARMYLAQAGIPSRSSSGFELFDKADYGMSEFSQKINYQRAMEGELARSIMSMSEVEYARVHLTFKKTSLYQPAEEPPKASVIVRPRAQGALNPQRVRGIQQVVASAVEGMAVERVAVLNEDGLVLSSSDGAAAAPEHQQLTAQVEQALKQKAEQLLLRPLGSNGADVSVRVQMNFDRVKSISEQPLADKRSIRREKTTASTDNSTGESNSKRSQNNREVDYEVGKERAETEHATGKIERITVGIVLSTPSANAQLKEIQDLLEAALGLDPARGDRLVIAYIPPKPAAAGVKPADLPIAASPMVASGDPQASPGVAVPWMRWGVAALAAALSVILLMLWMVTRKREPRTANSLPRLSSMEREQLLGDLRRWLVEGR
ncbi:flagellar basal-body MS-ring/collar protein FliF [Pseudomonas sp. B22129]|uniref:flagellar basal-body MS-ring/collar protein FliF n=1 Tax=Pseudomonas sp. B22129 TaxID=3235111 RepID=UPI00378335AD